MIKKINLTLTIIALSLAIVLFISRNNIAMSKGNAMLEVYSKYDFDILQVNIKSSATILNKNLELEYKDESTLLNHILDKMKISDVDEIENTEIENTKIYKIEKDTDDAKVIIEVDKSNFDKTKLHIDIILYQNEKSLLYLQDKIKKVYKSLNMEGNINITVIGTYDKKISQEECRRVAKRIFSCIKSNMIEEYETERLYSAYGYTSLINDYRNIEDNKVNVHLALRYNEYEGKTYLYLASPIIAEDY